MGKGGENLPNSTQVATLKDPWSGCADRMVSRVWPCGAKAQWCSRDYAVECEASASREYILALQANPLFFLNTVVLSTFVSWFRIYTYAHISKYHSYPAICNWVKMLRDADLTKGFWKDPIVSILSFWIIHSSQLSLCHCILRSIRSK